MVVIYILHLLEHKMTLNIRQSPPPASGLTSLCVIIEIPSPIRGKVGSYMWVNTIQYVHFFLQ
jgi:hypothetical protein